MAQQDPSNPNQYGPFTSVLTDPLTPQSRQVAEQRPSGFTGRGGQLAYFANQFLQGASQARQRKYQESERNKMEQDSRVQLLYDDIVNRPNITQEGKQQAQEYFAKYKAGQIKSTLDQSKDTKDHPLHKFLGSIADSIVGPTENKKHKGDDHGEALSALMGIAQQSAFNPQEVEGRISQGIDSILEKIRTGTPGTTPAPPTMGVAGPQLIDQGYLAQSAPGAPPQQPVNFPMEQKAGAPGIPAVLGREPYYEDVIVHPEVGKIFNEARNKYGIDWTKNPTIAAKLQSLPQRPAPLNALQEQQVANARQKATYEAEDRARPEFGTYQVTEDGKLVSKNALRYPDGRVVDSETKQPVPKNAAFQDGNTSAVVASQNRANNPTPKFHTQQAGDGTFWVHDQNNPDKPATQVMITDAAGNSIPLRNSTAMQRLIAGQAYVNQRNDANLSQRWAAMTFGAQEKIAQLEQRKLQAKNPKDRAAIQAVLDGISDRLNSFIAEGAPSTTPAPPGTKRGAGKPNPNPKGQAPADDDVGGANDPIVKLFPNVVKPAAPAGNAQQLSAAEKLKIVQAMRNIKK